MHMTMTRTVIVTYPWDEGSLRLDTIPGGGVCAGISSGFKTVVDIVTKVDFCFIEIQRG